MRARREPLFLERLSYRRRRVEDAARLLPLLGAFLFLLPLLARYASVAQRGLYVFLVWFGLIAGAALISRALARMPTVDGDDEGGAHGDVGDAKTQPAAHAHDKASSGSVPAPKTGPRSGTSA
ncbi:hypothetical protein [Aliiroseovarius marinus]|uniref:hypothetical protein n=1 Tax=Aliiroseovarius marinus TaxID=2500159 RepID=UPI003D7CEDA2